MDAARHGLIEPSVRLSIGYGHTAQRMAQSTGRFAMIIAHFLKETTGEAAECLHAGNILVIDEASMVNRLLL